MRSSQAGDFERFIAAANPSLLRQAYVYTGNVDEARDLVQETLLRTWRNWNVSCYWRIRTRGLARCCTTLPSVGGVGGGHAGNTRL